MNMGQFVKGNKGQRVLRVGLVWCYGATNPSYDEGSFNSLQNTLHPVSLPICSIQRICRHTAGLG